MSSESAPTNGFDLAALVHGDDRADLSAPADHEKLVSEAQAASNGDGATPGVPVEPTATAGVPAATSAGDPAEP